jgi:hypothetical protein
LTAIERFENKLSSFGIAIPLISVTRRRRGACSS